MARRSGWRRGALIAGLFAASLLLAVIDVFLITQRRITIPVGFGQVLHQFREAPGRTLPATSPTAPPGAAPLLPPGAPQPASPVVPAQASTRGGASVPTVNPSQPTSRPAGGPYVLPPEGVYRYRTAGGESISVVGASHSYPPETYASIRHLGGCQWRNEFDVIKEHVDVRRVCNEPGQIAELEDQRQITFFGQTDSEDLRCDPPFVFDRVGEAAGTTLMATCRSSDATAHVTARYIGVEPQDVGGTIVPAVHIVFHAVVTGRAGGTADEEMWIHPETGLIIRWVRASDADANTLWGFHIHYRERASFYLESLTPST